VTNSYFEIRKSSIQGKGAFALRTIRKGTRLIEYVGERISEEEADARYEDAQMKRHHTFLFVLEDGETIDAMVGGNESRFINHSCAPNCESVEEDGRIFIESIATIQPGEELVYDYSFARTEETTAEDEEFYKCRCGAPSCRGTILVAEEPKKTRKKTAKKKAPARKKAPATRKKAPATKKKAPATRKKAPATKKKAPATKKKAPATKKTGKKSAARR
jgi:hypothetical protein